MAQNANFSFQDYTSLLLTVGPALITYQQSTVAISHFNALGAEIETELLSLWNDIGSIVRQLVTNGVTRLTIRADPGEIDDKEIEAIPLFLPADEGHGRRETVLKRLQAINAAVQIIWESDWINLQNLPRSSFFVASDADSIEELSKINNECRQYGVRFIVGLVCGAFGAVFVDPGLHHHYFDNYSHQWPHGLINSAYAELGPSKIVVEANTSLPHKIAFLTSPRVGFSTTTYPLRESNGSFDDKVFLGQQNPSWSDQRQTCESKLHGKSFTFSIAPDKQDQICVDDPDGTLSDNISFLRSWYFIPAQREICSYPIGSFDWLYGSPQPIKDPSIIISDPSMVHCLPTYVSFLQRRLKSSMVESSDSTLFHRLQCGSRHTLASTTNIISGVISKEILKIATENGSPLGQWLFFDSPLLFPEWLPIRSNTLFEKKVHDTYASLRLVLLGSGPTAMELSRLLGRHRVGTAPRSRISLIPYPSRSTSYEYSNAMLLGDSPIETSRNRGHLLADSISRFHHTADCSENDQSLKAKRIYIYSSPTETSYSEEIWKTDLILSVLDCPTSLVLDNSTFFGIPTIQGGACRDFGSTYTSIPRTRNECQLSAAFTDSLENRTDALTHSPHGWVSSAESCAMTAINDIRSTFTTDSRVSSIFLAWVSDPSSLNLQTEIFKLESTIRDAKLLMEVAQVSNNLHNSSSSYPGSSPSSIDVALDLYSPHRRLRIVRAELKPFVNWAVAWVQEIIELVPSNVLRSFPIDKLDREGNPFWGSNRVPPQPRKLDFEDEDVCTSICIATVLKAVWSNLVFVPSSIYIPSSSSSFEYRSSSFGGSFQNCPGSSSPNKQTPAWNSLKDVGNFASALREEILAIAKEATILTLQQFRSEQLWNDIPSEALASQHRHIATLQAAIADQGVVKAFSNLSNMILELQDIHMGNMWLVDFCLSNANLRSKVYSLGVIHPLDILQYSFNSKLVDVSTASVLAGYMAIEVTKLVIEKAYGICEDDILDDSKIVIPQDHYFGLGHGVFQSATSPEPKVLVRLGDRNFTCWDYLRLYLPMDCTVHSLENVLQKDYGLTLQFLCYEVYMISSPFLTAMNYRHTPIRKLLAKRCAPGSLNENASFTIFTIGAVDANGVDLDDLPQVVVHWIPNTDGSEE